VRRGWILCGAIAVAACGRRDEDPQPRQAPIANAAPIDAGAALAPAAVPDAAPPPAADTRDEHAVFAFGDNRLTAHRTVDGDLVVDGGSAGFARYMRFGLPAPRWTLRVTRDGERAAAADKLASLDLPLTDEQASSPLLLVRVWAAAPRTLAIKINGRKADDRAGSAQLDAGWQTVAIAVAPGRWVAGENQVVVETSAAKGAHHVKASEKDDRVAIAWLRVAKDPQGDDDPRAKATYDAQTDRWSLADGAGLAWYVQVPDGAHVVARAVGGGACRVEVGAKAGDGTFAGGLLGGGATHVDLSPLGGKVVRLELRARDCPLTALDGARVTVPGPAPTVPAPGAAPKYVVLWMMDAFRAASVRPFTPGARAEVPNFERLAETGTIFRQYYDQGNESQTSHSSVWTSTYPAVHNVRLAGVGGTWRIDKQFEVIAQVMKAAGFHTIGVTANGFIEESGGYTRGFDDYRNLMREKNAINGIVLGKTVIASALDKLHGSLDHPTFLFVGTVDTHGPYIARHPWLEKYDPGPYTGPFQEFGTAFDLGISPNQMGCQKIPPARDIQRLRAIYDSAVSYQDARLGDFVAQLEKWGIYDQTLLIVTADHGEEMFEHGRCGHGESLTDTLLHVPLLVHYPARFPGGAIVDEGAEGIDLLPTILDAIGAPAPRQAQGRSLRALSFGTERGWAEPSYASFFELGHAMRLGNWKAIVGRTGVPQVFDLAADPWEMTDVAAQHPIERRFLTDALGLFLAERKVWKKADWGVVTNMTPKAAIELDAP
jgi:arylsulfatase A-like enzyme